MTIEDTIKKLKNDRLWNQIYNKWKKRRSRNKGKLMLERTREKALSEYYLIIQQLKIMGKEYTNSSEDTGATIPKFNDEEKVYTVSIGGRIYSNKEWERLMALQQLIGDTSRMPSEHPDLDTILYLKRIFRKDKDPSRKNKSVNLW